MNLRQLAALMRRHVLAVAVVLVLAASIGYTLKRAQPPYQETGTVILGIPPSPANPDPYGYLSDSLVDTGDVMVRTLMSAQSQQQLRAAGATGSFNVGLANAYNEEYPNYQPYITVAASSSDPDSAHHTFTLVVKGLSDDFSTAQAEQGVPQGDWITEKVIGDSGPVAQAGSPKREYGMFIILTIIVMFTVLFFLDRHPARLPGAYVVRRYLRGHDTYAE